MQHSSAKSQSRDPAKKKRGGALLTEKVGPADIKNGGDKVSSFYVNIAWKE